MFLWQWTTKRDDSHGLITNWGNGIIIVRKYISLSAEYCIVYVSFGFHYVFLCLRVELRVPNFTNLSVSKSMVAQNLKACVTFCVYSNQKLHE